jgi:hypothetical protein
MKISTAPPITAPITTISNRSREGAVMRPNLRERCRYSRLLVVRAGS